MPTDNQIKEAMYIRCIENGFIELFSQGKLNGTVHTSVGQEFSAIAFAGQLEEDDFVVSNHRCHGHYLAYTKDYEGLVAELMGKAKGVCGGIGSSQHLQRGKFFSNGIQGGIMPVAAGMALANKLSGNGKIGVVFIGDGTLGQGVVYETLNIISLWNLPLLVVCENNQYAQSTSIKDNLAGDILKRAEAFGINTFKGNTQDVDGLLTSAMEAISQVRHNGSPGFFLVNTYRLNAHSKGDDNRDLEEVRKYKEVDFINNLLATGPQAYKKIYQEANKFTADLINKLLGEEELSFNAYNSSASEKSGNDKWEVLNGTKDRQINLINKAFKKWLSDDKKNIFIGEDVHSPYGGAFKASKDLSNLFPDQVFTTPISEAAITGIGNGLALSGYRPLVEIMFGDFITLAFDQIVNHAAKFFYMYNKKIACPLVVRTPMGGRRGYGPTHSQTLDRFLIGIENVTTVALNVFVPPEEIYEKAFKESHAVIVIENKTDYGKTVEPPNIKNYRTTVSRKSFPVVRVSPEISDPTLTIVTYGGMASVIIECVEDLFRRFDLKPEVIVLSCINPVDYGCIVSSCKRSRRIVVVEEGPSVGGIGSEIVSSILDLVDFQLETHKIGAIPLPIPSVQSLENAVLPSKEFIIQSIGRRFA